MSLNFCFVLTASALCSLTKSKIYIRLPYFQRHLIEKYRENLYFSTNLWCFHPNTHLPVFILTSIQFFIYLTRTYRLYFSKHLSYHIQKRTYCVHFSKHLSCYIADTHLSCLFPQAPDLLNTLQAPKLRLFPVYLTHTSCLRYTFNFVFTSIIIVLKAHSSVQINHYKILLALNMYFISIHVFTHWSICQKRIIVTWLRFIF